MSGPQESLKKCKACGEIKDESEFQYSSTTKDRLDIYCNKCKNERSRKCMLFRKYGITEIEYRMMLESQNEVCAICKQSETSVGRGNEIVRFAVDHNHKTLKVRGLLCRRCNTVLGHINDDIKILKKMITYLEN